eukprot:1406257-Pyramimonas_sp.AAC.1
MAAARSWSRAWRALPLETLRRTLLAGLACSFVVARNLVCELLGLCIGGSISSAAVSVRLAHEEFLMLGNVAKLGALDFWSYPPIGAALKWRRHVDVQMSFRLCYCPACMKIFVANMFSEPVSVAFQSTGCPTR